ncbi:MAG: Nif3-like dinuclear metal center hexameric protein [Bacteroidota bacterium]
MLIKNVLAELASFAPLSLQESYDNAGLITGQPDWSCQGVLCTLDATEEVILEAISKGCNLVVAHHPILFRGLKKLNGKNYVEKALITAIKNDIAIYACHTNLDNVANGVNKKIADKLGLEKTVILSPKEQQLLQLITFVPTTHLEQVRSALFHAGAGTIGLYHEASFGVEGTGTFKGMDGANPTIGQVGERTAVAETRLEVVVPTHLRTQVHQALIESHPYEEVAHSWIALLNERSDIGSGLIGSLPSPMEEKAFLQQLSTTFSLQVIRHTPLLQKQVSRVAVCGGAGSFLLETALAAGADFFVTADLKYHEFFDANGRMVVADIGHWESEQFTPELLVDVLQSKFPTFAVLKSGVDTNPVQYFSGK